MNLLILLNTLLSSQPVLGEWWCFADMTQSGNSLCPLSEHTLTFDTTWIGSEVERRTHDNHSDTSAAFIYRAQVVLASRRW